MKKILSIDGGGVRGYFIAYTINKLKKEENIDIYDYFDLFVGTSTGSIIASWIIMKKDYQVLVDMYDNATKDMWYKAKEIKGDVYYSFEGNDFLKWLKDYFGNISMNEIYKQDNKTLILPVVKNYNSEPFPITTPNISKNSKEFKLYEAIYASCAAPLFYKPLVMNGEEYVDGGLYSMNPALEAVNLITQKNISINDLTILSFATSSKEVPNKRPGIDYKNKANAIILAYEASLRSQTLFTNQLLENLINKKYKRIWINEGIMPPINNLTSEFKSLVAKTYVDIKDDLIKYLKNL